MVMKTYGSEKGPFSHAERALIMRRCWSQRLVESPVTVFVFLPEPHQQGSLRPTFGP